MNNGVMKFCQPMGNEQLDKANCITVSPVDGSSFFQPVDFLGRGGAGSSILMLRNEQLCFSWGQFATRAIQQTCSKYTYGHMGNKESIKRERIMLPVTDSGNPDYEYMTEYTQQKREAMLSKYRAYVEKRIAELGEPAEIPVLNEKEWREFSLDNIFTVGAGKRLETRNKIPGTRPFVGATDNGNGVTGFVGNDNVSKDNNVLGVNYNGAPCIAFYHPYECIFTDDVKRLHLRNYKDNIFVLLFFTSVFTQQRSKYSYGYKFNEQRMLRQKLMLPVNNSGEPDYKYMEQYSKNMMLKKYKQYLAYMDRKGDQPAE